MPARAIVMGIEGRTGMAAYSSLRPPFSIRHLPFPPFFFAVAQPPYRLLRVSVPVRRAQHFSTDLTTVSLSRLTLLRLRNSITRRYRTGFTYFSPPVQSL